MKLFRKSMSVFLVVVLLMTACLPAVSGAAASISYNEQYNALANLLVNDHVRELSNYQIENNKSEDIVTEGFNSDAGAFAYSHVVYAKDNVDNVILRAANRFYYIAESLMSYTYGVGVYSADLLYRTVLYNLQGIFDNMTLSGWFDMDNQPVKLLDREKKAYEEAVKELGGNVTKEALLELGFSYYYDEDVTFYVDNLGTRYYPTDEELVRYEEARAALLAEGNAFPTVGDLSAYEVSFVETTIYDYYNIETVISYFMGTGSDINTGNWYHDFDFIVRTDMETVLLNMESLSDAPSSIITVTTGIYRFRYQRQFDSLGTKAQYFFKQTDNADTYAAYASTYGLANNPQVISYLTEGDNAVGQAANLYTVETTDSTTLGNLKEINRRFNEIFATPSWDKQFLSLNNADLAPATLRRQHPEYYQLLQEAKNLTETYSNDVLVNLFSGTIGNIKTLQYLLTSSRQAPTRIVSGTTSYDGTVERLDSIVKQFDDLFTNEDVMATINMFLGDTLNDMFVGTAAEGKTYNTAQEMVGVLLNGLLYDQSLCTTIVKSIYPMIADLLVNLVDGIDLSGLFESLAGTLNVTLTPEPLGELLEDDYPYAAAPLIAAGDKLEDWADVNWDAMDWTHVDDYGNKTPVNDRDSFAYALVAAFRGLRRAVLCLFANDNHWTVDIPLLVELEEQAAYRDLIIPLFEALGLRAADNVTNENCQTVTFPEPGQFFHSGHYTIRARNEVLYGDSYLLDIVMPLLLWVENIVAKQPIQTVFSLLPSLVNFIIRRSSANDHLDACLNKIELNLTILSGIKVDIDSLGGLLSGVLPPLDSLNNILAEFINLSTTDENGNEVAYALPQIHEQKWVDSCGTVVQSIDPYDEVANVSAYTHYLEVTNPGYSFLFVLRFVLTALGYRYTIEDGVAPPYLIECFGIDLDDELFLGMTFGDIIFNVMLHPDEALCALLELFYPNENEVSKGVGNYYEGYEYAYPLEQIEFYTDILLNTSLNPTRGYGTKVVYTDMWTQEMSNELVADLGPLADNVLSMLGIEGMENGLGAFLEDLIYGFISDDTVNMLFNMIYQLLSGVDGSLGDIDIVKMLDYIFNIEFTPDRAALRVKMMLGSELPPAEDTENNRPSFWTLGENTSWQSVFLAPDAETGEMVVTDVNYNWGIDNAEKNYGMSKGEAFIRIVSALLSPASFLFEFLLLDQPLSVFGLISLPSYAGYQYWFISLLELLTCPAEKIVNYKTYYEQTILLKETNRDLAECNTFYYILSPIIGLVDAVIADPIGTVFNLLPNLMFFISIGAMNDFVNNLAHFAFVLLDVLKPILNAYDLLGGLLANLDLGGFKLNLSLPLNIDFNSLVGSLVSSLTGSLLVLGTKEIKDENGNVIKEEDITLTLPYIDLYSLCAGKLERFDSKEMRRNVRLDDNGGGDLITALLRLVVSVLFIEENLDAVVDLLMTVSDNLDEYDRETVVMLLDELSALMEGFATPDIVLVVLYYLITTLADLSTTLVDLLADSGLTIMDLIAVLSAGDVDAIIDFITGLGGDEEPQPGDSVDTGTAVMSIFDKIKAFFDKLLLFFKKAFGLA